MQVKTITTVAGVNEIDFGNDNSQSTAHFYWLKNLGDSTLYVSANPNPVAEKDDVAELPAKGAVSVETDEGKVYVLGAGKVEIHRTNSKFCPFDWQSSGSGGGGGGSITVDSELSDTSTNPLQNKVTTAAINEVKSSVETLEATLTQTQEDVSANTAALETKSDINHIHDISASGNPVIMDNLQGGVPFSEMVVSGKNLLKYPYEQTTRTSYGITFTDNGDGSITASGTHDGGSQLSFFGFSPWWANTNGRRLFLPKGNTVTFRITGLPDTYNSEIFVMKDSTSNDKITSVHGAGESAEKYTAEQDCYIACGIYGSQSSVGQAVDFTAYPQLELGETVTEYEPPITGRELTVNVSGKNLFGDAMNYYLSGTQETGFNFKPSSVNSFCFLGIIIPNTNYTIKNYSDGNRFKIVLFKNYPDQASPDECMEILPTDSNTATFNSSEYNYCVLSVAYDDDNITIKKAQLEFGDTATEYEPYHGSTTTITPTSNPYIIPNDISQQDGYNVISVSEGELSVVGVQKNAAIKRIWDDVKTLLGDISQFLVGRSKGLSDLIELWVGLGELSDPRCYRLIPVLSSNVGTNGVASCNTEATFGTNETAYQAFDNNIATYLSYIGENVSGGWVMYEFISPVCISKMSASVGIGLTGNSFDFHFEYYDDVSKMWVIFGDEMNVSGLTGTTFKNFEMISDIVTTTKVRIISNTEKVEKTNWLVSEFQVYGYMSE